MHMLHAKLTSTQKVQRINVVATILLDIHTTAKMADEIVVLERPLTQHHWSVAVIHCCPLVVVQLLLQMQWWKQLRSHVHV